MNRPGAGPTRSAGRRYLLRFAVAMGCYVVLLAVALLLLPLVQDSVWRYPVALLPVLPLVAVAWAFWRYLAEADELQRRIQLEALGFAFGVGSVLTFGAGLLQTVGLRELPWTLVWPVYAACWLVGYQLARRRFR